MNNYQCIAPDVRLGQNVKLSKFINLYGCEIGDETKVGSFRRSAKEREDWSKMQDLEPHFYL